MTAISHHFRRWLPTDVAPLSLAERSRSALAAAAGLACAALFAHLCGLSLGGSFLITPIAASTVILFALPHSPLGQPWPFVGGSMIAAVIGLACAHAIPTPLLAGICAVGIAIWCMGWLRCIHPPAGAQALLFATGGKSLLAVGVWPALGFLLLNLGGMLVAALLLNNVLPGRRYPAGGTPESSGHGTRDLPADHRLGIVDDDLRHAVERMDTYLDISSEDLVAVYNLAIRRAFDRISGLRCGDIMSRDVVAVEFATDLDEAWRLLDTHHLKALPVLDRARRVIGIVTRYDFLHQLPSTGTGPLAQRLAGLLRRTTSSHSDKPEVVGQIMHSPVYTVHDDDGLEEIAARLSDNNHHHVPVLDHERRLAGMLTQSDLVAALYQRNVLSRHVPV